MSITTKEALLLIHNFCLAAKYPLESVLAFIKEEGEPNILFEKGSDMIRYNDISNKARKYLEKEREELLQEKSPEDYEF